MMLVGLSPPGELNIFFTAAYASCAVLGGARGCNIKSTKLNSIFWCVWSNAATLSMNSLRSSVVPGATAGMGWWGKKHSRSTSSAKASIFLR